MAGGEDADSGEKSFDPTPKRLEEARKRGEVPQSADLTTAAGYGGFLLAAAGLGVGLLLDLGDQLTGLLDRSNDLATLVFSGPGTPVIGGILVSVLLAVLPWFVVPAAFALLAIIAQQGFVVAPSRLEPKWSRLSPISALGHKFGPTGLVEFGKGLFKLSLYSIVLGVFLLRSLPEIVGSLALSPAAAVAEMLRQALSLLLIVLLIAVTLGLADLVWQHLSFLQRNRMTRKEVTDEQKEAEGDPFLKGQRRQRGIGIAMNQMLADVAKADVIIVNPTHYAVALAWDRGSSRAPVCVAKGTDEIAARIREIAAEHAVPIRRDPPTARALHAAVGIGEEIGREHFRAVAAAIRFAESLRRRARGAA